MNEPVVHSAEFDGVRFRIEEWGGDRPSEFSADNKVKCTAEALSWIMAHGRPQQPDEPAPRQLPFRELGGTMPKTQPGEIPTGWPTPSMLKEEFGVKSVCEMPMGRRAEFLMRLTNLKSEETLREAKALQTVGLCMLAAVACVLFAMWPATEYPEPGPMAVVLFPLSITGLVASIAGAVMRRSTCTSNERTA
jgi:hypothetical protein